jgi:hypothetical protein
MKKTIILLSMFLLSLMAISAAAYEVDIQPIKGEIESGESAQFLIVITSDYSSIKEVKLYSPDIEWDVPTEVIKVYPTTETNHKITITPSKYVEPGKIYGVKINFKDTITDEVVYSGIAQVDVKSSDKAVSSYKPSVRMTVDMPSTIDPSKAVTAKIKLENQNLLNLEGMILKAESDIGEFEAEQKVKLDSLAKKIVELNYNLNPLQDPGEYKLSFQLIYEKQEVEKVAKTITISEARPVYQEEETKKGFLFKTVITKKLTSISNVEDTQTIKIPTSGIKSWFTSSNLDESTVTEGGQKYIAIDVTLQPGETKDLVVVVSYRIIFYIILLAAILLAIHYRYRSPISIKKGLSDVNAKEGGISEMKVTLELTNNDKKNIKKVTITDYVPNIAHIQREFAEGTLKPSRVFRHKNKGMILKWDIDELSPGEDRIMSYTIKSKLSIVGQFRLPRAKVSFKKKGREIIGYSNSAGAST